MSPRRRGSSAIEFGLSLPFMMLVFAGIVDLYFYMSRLAVVSGAARDACRAGAGINDPKNPADGVPLEEAAEALGELVLQEAGLGCPSGCSVQATWNDNPFPELDTLVCEVRYPYQPLVGLVPGLSNQIFARFEQVSQEQQQ